MKRLFYSTAEEGHGDLAESLPFLFHFISMCVSDAHPLAKQRYCLSQGSAALAPLPVVVVVVVEDLGFTMLLTSQVISVALYSEREKSDKFCSEALISA